MRFFAFILFVFFVSNQVEAHFLKISTDIDEVQEQFSKGYMQLFAYNFPKAESEFKRALTREPHCLMCRWGLAQALKKQKIEKMQEFWNVLEELSYTELPRGHKTFQWEKDFFQLLKSSFSSHKMSNLELQKSFAKNIYDYYTKNKNNFPYPSELLAHLSDELYYQVTLESSAQRIHLCCGNKMASSANTLLRALLKEAVSLYPNHPGILHTFIHTFEMDHDENKSLFMAADKLRSVSAQEISHFEHMPTHVYWRRGLYEQAIQANLNAIEVDEKFIKQGHSEASSYYYVYHHLHNYAFLNNLYILKGEKEPALKYARELKSKAFGEHLKLFPRLNDYYQTIHLQTLVRFGCYKEFFKNLEAIDLQLNGRVMISFLKALSHFNLGEMKAYDVHLKTLKHLKEQHPDHFLLIVSVPYLEALEMFKNGESFENIENLFISQNIKNVEDILAHSNPNYWYFWSSVLLYKLAKLKNISAKMDFYRKKHHTMFPRAHLAYEFF